MKFGLLLAGAAVAAIAMASQANAATIMDGSGQFEVGLAADGELFEPLSGIGFRRAGSFDPLAGEASPNQSPGRDSWGVSAGPSAAYADAQGFFGSSGVTTVLGATANSATATTTTSIGLTVGQDFSFVGAGNILRIDTSVTNVSGGALSARFQRNIDWDIAPTEFNETFAGIFGANGSVIDASLVGFEDADPNVDYVYSCFTAFDCTVPLTSDIGAGIKINLGSLAAGSTARFSYFYGLNLAGTTLDDLIGQGQAVGATYILGAQSSENGDYPLLGVNSTILGVSDVTVTAAPGGGAVPEPATWAMMLLGFFSLGALVRRQRAFA